MSASIGDILNATGQEQPEVTETVEPETEATEVDATEAAPESEAKPETEPKAEPTPDAEPKPPSDVPTQALLEERAKRQAAEYELQLIKQREQAPKQEAADVPVEFDFDNPQAFVDALRKQQGQAMRTMEQNFETRWLNVSEANARARHTDWDDKLTAFREAAGSNPALVQQARAAQDPGEFIYQAGKASQELGAVGGDLDAYRAKVRAELLAEVEAEAKAKAAAQPNVPESESAARSASPTKGPAPAVHQPLSEILKR